MINPKLQKFQVVYKEDSKTVYGDFTFQNEAELFKHFDKYLNVDIQEVRKYVYEDKSLFVGTETNSSCKISHNGIDIRISSIKSNVDIKGLFLKDFKHKGQKIDSLSKFVISRKVG